LPLPNGSNGVSNIRQKEEVHKTIDIIIPPFCPSLMAPMEFQTLGILFSLAKNGIVLERPITIYSLFFSPPPPPPNPLL
jgi:hypothetical protein